MSGGKIFMVTGIDTGIGKTIATGLIARSLVDAGVSVITHKGVQTGATKMSEDILVHRQMMGKELLAEDRTGATCRYLFAYPCSPHLAARLAGTRIDPAKIGEDAASLAQNYEVVLVEGAGGLFVPLTEDFLLLDLLVDHRWPVLLVTSSRLGSINHTLASLEALARRDLPLAGLIYNRFEEEDRAIGDDSLVVMRSYLTRYGFECPVVEMRRDTSYRQPGSCQSFLQLCGR